MPKADRLPELGPRGEGWLVLQLLLGAAIIGCGFAGVYWPGSADSFLGILGLLIAVAGVLLVVVGVLSLGRSFTPCHDRAPARVCGRAGSSVSCVIPSREA
jgi:hypothetical protein